MGNVRPGIFCHHFMTILMRWGGPFVTVNKVELTPCAIRKKKRRRKGHSLYLLHLLAVCNQRTARAGFSSHPFLSGPAISQEKVQHVVGALEGEGCSVTIIEEEEEEEQKSWTKKKRGGALAGRKEYLRKEVRTVLYIGRWEAKRSILSMVWS